MSLRHTWQHNRATIVAGTLVLLIVMGALAWLFISRRAPHAELPLVARIHDGDGQTHELPLQQYESLTVSSSLGVNVVEVSSGAVSVIDADCPSKDCVHQTAISQPGQQIICMPHKLWIEIVQADSTQSTEMDIGAVKSEGSDSATYDRPSTGDHPATDASSPSGDRPDTDASSPEADESSDVDFVAR
ncbi:MAG: NusG domain II-containing protein [Atopobiaceae bacterium]|nr:NusG domain II-containing protein [Atopobiaceae bacterium]